MVPRGLGMLWYAENMISKNQFGSSDFGHFSSIYIFLIEIEAPEVALSGIGRNFSCLSGARSEGSYSFETGCKVENVFYQSSLRSD